MVFSASSTVSAGKPKKIKAKFKYADKLEIPYVMIIGEDEIQKEIVKLKNMTTGEEKEISFNEIDSLKF